MTKRSSSFARVLAAAALVCGVLALIWVISSSLGGDGGGESQPAGHAKRRHHVSRRDVPAAYVVRNGDTLIGIAHRTGVPLARIQALNPGVDPQVLIAGEKLKLR